MQPYFNMSREKSNQIGSFNYENDWCVLQFHSQIEICIIHEGEMEAFVDGKQKTLKKGEVSVALSFSPHAYKTPVHSRSSIIFIPTYLCEEFTELTKNKRLTSPFISNSNLYETLKDYFSLLHQDNVNEIKSRGLMYMILGTILENVQLEDLQNPINTELISKILFYINENFKNDISPSKIAEHFGYSQSHISRYFKSCCSINLIRYIALMRLRNVVMLLHEGQHTLTECILESGFSSNTTFYRTFKKEFGCSPKEYIKKSNTHI
ncbi:MAG: helix-turn-helix transcriptional regulator [Ruminococcaceae bacterium]|nr:helix-turn-helix transcriptional regulator [Oscillospiraceae bacterium]